LIEPVKVRVPMLVFERTTAGFPNLQPYYGEAMKEKVKKLNLQRDYKKYLYFIDGEGNVCQKPKSGEGDAKVLVERAVDRDNSFLYFIDKDGDVARSARSSGRKKAA
jgi:hypothetical protein